MPIEFRCHQCNKLLRVGEDAAGKQAKCPACGAVQVIPAPAGTVQPLASPRAPDPASGGGPPSFDLNQLAGYADNPYAAPASAAMPLGEVRRQTGPRTGPTWERNGPSLASFFATARDFFLSPVQFYSQMRRTGGPWSPSSFVYIGIGLKYAQETSTGAAVAGVMLPAMICGGGFTLLIVAAVMAT